MLFQGWLCCINAVLADKGYDTNEIRVWLKERHLQAVIPPKSNRIEGIECDFLQYKERHVIECLFSKLKYYRRRVATRSFLLALFHRIMYIMLNTVVFRTPQPSIIFTVSSLYKIINTLFFNLTHTIMQIRKSMLFIGDDYFVLIDMGTKMQTFQTD